MAEVTDGVVLLMVTSGLQFAVYIGVMALMRMGTKESAVKRQQAEGV